MLDLVTAIPAGLFVGWIVLDRSATSARGERRGLYKVELIKPPLALSGRFRSLATNSSASASGNFAAVHPCIWEIASRWISIF